MDYPNGIHSSITTFIPKLWYVLYLTHSIWFNLFSLIVCLPGTTSYSVSDNILTKFLNMKRLTFPSLRLFTIKITTLPINFFIL